MLTPAQLKEIPIFEGLGKKELKRIAACALEIDVEADAHVLHEGRFAFEFIVIQKGAAKVVRDGSHIADLGPGDVVGEIGALTHGQRNADVITTAPTRVIYIRAQDFRHLTQDYPELGARIQAVVKERTRAVTDPDLPAL
jgi:CRP-like cAMP-binding protein